MWSQAIGAVVGAAMLVVASPAAAQSRPCEPGAVVEGDPDIAGPVARHLAQLGIARTSDGDCRPLRASVNRDGDRVAVSVRDSSGRRATRTVTDARIAATWIESWARPDLGAPLLVVRAPLALRPASQRRSDAAAPVATAAAAPHRSRLSLAIATHLITGDDDSSWQSLSASGCWRFGLVCPGLAARVAENEGFSHNGGLTESTRTSVDLLAELRFPISLGRASLVPAVGLGVVWMQTSRYEPQQQGWSDPDCAANPELDPFCEEIPPFVIDDGFVANTFQLKARATLSISVPITASISLDLGAGIETTPNAHTRPFNPPMDEGDPPSDNSNNPDQPSDPNDPTFDPPNDQWDDPLFQLPGEPGVSWWWGIGLRFGGH